MARQVLTYPDIPPVLTQAAADTRYALAAHDHDAAYATVAHLHTGVYLPVAHEPGVDPHTQYYNQTRGDARYQPVGSYLTTSVAASTYLPLVGGTLTGLLTMTPTAGATYPVALVANGSIGIGSTPPLNHPSRPNMRIGDAGFLMGGPGYNALEIRCNSYQDAANTSHALTTNTAGALALVNNTLAYATAPSVTAGALQTFTNRLHIAPSGSVSLTADNLWTALKLGNAAMISTWAANTQAIQIGSHSTLFDIQGYSQWGNNTWNDTGADRAIDGAAMGSKLYQQNGVLVWLNAAIVAAGATQSMVERFRVATNGAISVTAAGAINAANLFWSGGNLQIGAGSPTANDGRITTGYNIQLNPGGGVVLPGWDAGVYLGSAALRYVYAYVVNGVVTGSKFDLKEDFAPLDPATCATAVLETDWVNFKYKPPAPPPDSEGAEQRAAHAKLVAETAPARQQKGYVLKSPTHKTHALFGLADRESANTGSDLAVVACALQHCLLEIAELKARLA